ncbi:MAG: LacI family DNA-binding transcriptional regulator [Verrucomicrobiota bacterium]
MDRQPNMRDVAEMLGVSVSTVSRALKRDPRITVETRDRVLEAAKQCGYRPNPMVSSLMATRKGRQRGEIGTLALITDYRGVSSWKDKDVCRWTYSGMVERANQLGYHITEFDLADYDYDSARLEETLLNRGIRGVLLGFSRASGEALRLTEGQFSVVGVSNYFDHLPADRVTFYGYYNVRLALQKLSLLGFRKCGLVVPALNNHLANNSWTAAYLDWQQSLEPAKRIEPYLPLAGQEGDLEPFKQWYERSQPEVVVVYKAPVKRLLEQMSLTVPDDVGLVYLYRERSEMDNTAGIDGRMDLVGGAAVDLIVEKLQRNLIESTENVKEIFIRGSWVDGPSLKTPAG